MRQHARFSIHHHYSEWWHRLLYVPTEPDESLPELRVRVLVCVRLGVPLCAPATKSLV